MGKILLDGLKGIEVDLDSPRIHNLHALWYLPEGLHILANQVRKYEIEIGNSPLKPSFMMAPGGPNMGMIACCFSWFSVSLVNYLRLVALVELVEKNNWSSDDIRRSKNHKDVKIHCREYVKDVAPAIYSWRNKISAHFAITDPFKDDDISTLEYSVMNLIVYIDPYYFAGAAHWGTSGDNSGISRWSLTETFSGLAPRLWPGRVLAELPKNTSIDNRQV